MEKDVICGMQVDPKKAAGQSESQGKTYYFCSLGCKRKFDSNPAQYAENKPLTHIAAIKKQVNFTQGWY